MNLGLGAASGLHSIVTFFPSAPYISGSNGFFLNDGRKAIKEKAYYKCFTIVLCTLNNIINLHSTLNCADEKRVFKVLRA